MVTCAAGLLAAGLVVLSAGPLEAQGAGSASPVPPVSACASRGADAQFVDVHFAELGSHSARFEKAFRELLRGEPVLLCASAVSVRDLRRIGDAPPAPPPAVARIWVDRRGEVVFVYIVNGAWDRVLLRRVPLAGDIDEVAVEEVAHIVQSSVEALLAGVALGVTRPEFVREQRELEGSAEATAAAPAPSAADANGHGPDAGVRVDIALRYAPRYAGPDVGVRHGAGLMASLRLGGGVLRPVIALTADYLAPNDAEGAGIRVRSEGPAARLLLGAAWLALRDTEVLLLAGAGVDVDFAGATPAGNGGATAAADQTEWLPFATGALALRHTLDGWLTLAVGVDVNVDLLDARYVVGADDGSVMIVANPWRVQPGAFVSVGGRL